MNGKRWSRWIAAILSVFLLMQSFPSVARAQELQPTESAAAEEEQSPVRLEEVLEKRSEYAKHFRMSDGTYQMVSYPAPVHYQKNQVWEEIDHTLIPAGDRVETRSSPLAVSFGLDRADKLVAIGDQKDGGLLTFDLVGKQQSRAQADRLEAGALSKKIKSSTAKKERAETDSIGEKLNNRIVFPGILTDTDLEYELGNGRLKESILIRRASAAPQYQFQIAGEAYRLILEEDQSISVYRRADGSLAYTIEAPYMFDAAGAESRDIDVLLSESGVGYLLTLKPSASWINAGERVFPVTLDPTVSIPNLMSQIQMASYSSANNRVSHASSILTSMSDGLGYTTNDTRSLYLKFTLPPLDYDAMNIYNDPINQPLAGSTVVDARLAVEAMELTDREYYPTFEVYRNKTVWNNGFGVSNRPTQEARIEAMMEKQASTVYKTVHGVITALDTIFSADITDMVRDWYRNPETNNGLYITPYQNDSLQNFLYDVRYTDAYNGGEPMPYIMVTYISNIGLEDYWTYTSDSLGMADFHVNHRNGSLTAVVQDTTSANQRNGVSVSHVYNDAIAINGQQGYENAIVGQGFMLNIQETLFKRQFNEIRDYDVEENGDKTPVEESQFYFLHVDEDGTYHYFLWNNETKRYEMDTDPAAVLSKMGTEHYKITYKDKACKEFENDYLTAYVDANGNRIEVELTMVGNAGTYIPVAVKEILNSGVTRNTTLEWTMLNDDTDKRQLQSIHSPDGNCVYFSYDSTGQKLTQFKWNKRKTFSGLGNIGEGENQALNLSYAGDSSLLASVGDVWTGDEIIFTRQRMQIIKMVKYVELEADATGNTLSRIATNLTFSYGNLTSVKDSLNKNYTMTYRFDRFGKTISVTDSLGNSKHFEFGASGGAKNKITLESKVMVELSNLIYDPYFITCSYMPGSPWRLSDNAGIGNEGEWNAIILPPQEYFEQTFRADRSGEYAFSANVEINQDGRFGLELYDEDGQLLASGAEEYADWMYMMNAELVKGKQYKLRCVNVAEAYYGPLDTAKVYHVVVNYGCDPDPKNWVTDGAFNFNYIDYEQNTHTSRDFWSIDCDDNNIVDFSDSMVKIPGKYSEKRRVFQTIHQSGAAGDELLFSGSAKSTGLPNKDNGDGTQTAVAMTLAVYYTDHTVDYETVFFATDREGIWHSASGALTAKKTFNMVEIYLKNDYNANDTFFDNVWVAKESFGTRYTVNNRGEVTAVTGRNGETATNTYNDMGQPLTQVDALGNTTSYTYGRGGEIGDTPNNNRLIQETAPLGNFTEYDYDAYGNTRSARIGASGFSASTAITEYLNCGETVYGNYGTVVSATKDAFGNTVHYTSDSTTLKTKKTVDPNGTTIHNKYAMQLIPDVAGSSSSDGPLYEVSATTADLDPLSRVSYGYENGAVNRILRSQFSYTFSQLHTPYRSGNVYAGKTTSAKESATTTAISGHTSGGERVLARQYYDKRGLPLQLEYGNYVANAADPLYASHLYSTTYDELGRLVGRRRGSGSSTGKFINQTYSYNREGNLYRIVETNRLKSASQVTQFTYNLAGQLTRKSVGGYGFDIQFHYGYDALGRVSSQLQKNDTGERNILSEYSYNANGQLAAQTYKTNNAAYLPQAQHFYDHYGRYTFSAFGWQGNAEKNLFRSVTYGNNSLSGKAQQTSRPERITLRYGVQDQTKTADERIFYEYDTLGNISKIRSYRENSLTESVSYTYDALGQLTGAVTTGADGAAKRQESYSYVKSDDEGYQGNIESVNKNGTIYHYHYDNEWNDLLTSITDAGGNTVKSYTYDTIGNPTSDGTRNFRWAFGRQLYQVVTNGSVSATYNYNGDGSRVEKETGGITSRFLVEEGKILSEVKTGRINKTLQYYYGQDGLEYIVEGSNKYWALKNLQGDILGLAKINTDGSGTLVCRYAYSAFGELLSVTDANGNEITDTNHIAHLNPFRYRGYYYDAETGFYYVSSRYYDPEVGRWINADDPEILLEDQNHLLQYNLFTYCFNNPVNMHDPDGYAAANIIGGIVGGVAGAALGYLLADQLGLTGWKKLALVSAATVGGAALGAFLGPYVAKLGGKVAAKLGIKTAKATFKSIAKITSHKMSHINVPKHLWGRVLKKVTNQGIESLIQRAIKKGAWETLKNGVTNITYKYGGEIIVVTGKVINGVFQVGDAWVKK